MDLKAYKKQLLALLPQGQAWPREEGTQLDDYQEAAAEELARIDTRSADLLRESYPLTCSELLTDWERITALPSQCIINADIDQTTQERKEAVHAKIGAYGGQSAAYYESVALNLGYTVTVTSVYKPFKASISKAGDALTNDEWSFWWAVNAPLTTIKEAKAGYFAAGDPLRTWDNTLLECTISDLKPAHTDVLFVYT